MSHALCVIVWCGGMDVSFCNGVDDDSLDETTDGERR